MIGKRDVFVPVGFLGQPGAVVRVDGDGEVVVSGAIVDDDQETVFGVDGAEGAVGDVVGGDGCGGGGAWEGAAGGGVSRMSCSWMTPRMMVPGANSCRWKG